MSGRCVARRRLHLCISRRRIIGTGSRFPLFCIRVCGIVCSLLSAAILSEIELTCHSYCNATRLPSQGTHAHSRTRSLQQNHAPRTTGKLEGASHYTTTDPVRHDHSQCSQAKTTENLNYLFGIAFSADDEPSLRIMACHALCACSSWIDDPLAQNLLFDLLRRTERENGWPWAYVEQRILATWQGGSR